MNAEEMETLVGAALDCHKLAATKASRVEADKVRVSV